MALASKHKFVIMEDRCVGVMMVMRESVWGVRGWRFMRQELMMFVFIPEEFFTF